MKKVLSLMLVLVLVLGMSTVAFAAVTVDKDSAVHATFTPTKAILGIDVNAQDTESVRSFPVLIDFVNVVNKSSASTPTWTGTSGTTLTEKERKDNKVTIKTTIQKGSAAIDEVKFSKSTVGAFTDIQNLTLVLTDTLKSNNTDGVEFEVKSYLVVDGRHWNNLTNDVITWDGVLRNRSETVDADYDYIWMGNGTIVEADEYIKSIECDLGEDVIVYAKMFKDKKYWAVDTTDPKDDDEEVMMDKNGIDTVYHLSNVGLAAVADYVTLDEDSSMFVYDGNFKYLGKGNDKLPWSDTYYLAAQQLDVEDDDAPIDEEIDDELESDPPETSEDLGGDDDYPANVNDNPGTGR